MIDDTTAPVANASSLADVTAQCSASAPTAPTATDNCSGTVTGTTTTSFPVTTQGTTVVTWTYTDAEGNTTTQTQNIVIDDTTAPVFTTSPSDVIVECDESSDPLSTEVVSSEQVLPGNYTVTMNDSYGDGWQSFMGVGIEVLFDGETHDNFTCVGSTTIEIVTVPSSVSSVEWRLYADTYDGERAFTIKDTNDVVIYTYTGLGGFSTTPSITPLTF